MTTATIGSTKNVIAVSFQLMYSSQPRLAAIVSMLRIAVVIVPDAADASWCASNVTFDWMTPAGVAS